jgi:hypothetical protein
MSESFEWCTKKQAAKLIGRTERTLSRIVRDAVEQHSEDILGNLKLVYADGREISGREATLELLAKNEQEGSRTRWFFRKLWWQVDFASRLKEATDVESAQTNPVADAKEPEPDREVVESLGERPTLPSDPNVRSVVLEHLHYSDRKHAIEIRQLTDRVLQVVETNQQLQAQTNFLYKDAQKQSGALRSLLVGTTATYAQPTDQQNAEQIKPAVIDLAEQNSPPSRPAPRPSKRTRTKSKPPTAKPSADKDRFPTFRRFARFFTRK